MPLKESKESLANWDTVLDLLDAPSPDPLRLIPWIDALLLNPFEVQRVLSQAQIERVKRFLLESGGVPWAVRKQALRGLAVLARDKIKEGASVAATTPITPTTETAIFDTPVPQRDFFCFSKKLAILDKTAPLPSLQIEDQDPIVIKRYKIKILSFISTTERVIEDIKRLVGLLNEESSKLGWTLCKALHHMGRLVERRLLVGDLLKGLGGRVFSNEAAWVNVLTVAGMWVLDDIEKSRSFHIEEVGSRSSSHIEEVGSRSSSHIEEVGSRSSSHIEEVGSRSSHMKNEISTLPDLSSTIDIALKYTNEFVPKAQSVREAALFLVWAAARKGLFICFERVLFTALFDSSFVCRRAAASVLQDVLGRCPYVDEYEDVRGDSGGIRDNRDAATGTASAMASLFLITPSSVKRPEERLKIFKKLTNKEKIRKFMEEALYSFDSETRRLAAEAMSWAYGWEGVEMRYRTVAEMDGVHLLCGGCLRRDATAYETAGATACETAGATASTASAPTFFTCVNSFRLSPALLKTRNILTAVSSYLPIARHFSRENLFQNVSLLISKGVPVDLREGAAVLFEDENFSKGLFSLIDKNPMGLLINSNNCLYKEAVIKKCLGNISKDRLVSISIDCLRLMGVFEEEVVELVRGRLGDYTVDFSGDAGYVNRRAAFVYVIARRRGERRDVGDMGDVDDMGCAQVHPMDPSNASLPAKDLPSSSVERLTVKFLADKSKRLRDEIIASLVASPPFSSHSADFPAHSPLPVDLSISVHLGAFKNFFEKHSQLIQSTGRDEAYFKALLYAFGEFEEFWEGLANTKRVADGRLAGVLRDMVSSSAMT